MSAASGVEGPLRHSGDSRGKSGRYDTSGGIELGIHWQLRRCRLNLTIEKGRDRVVPTGNCAQFVAGGAAQTAALRPTSAVRRSFRHHRERAALRRRCIHFRLHGVPQKICILHYKNSGLLPAFCAPRKPNALAPVRPQMRAVRVSPATNYMTRKAGCWIKRSRRSSMRGLTLPAVLTHRHSWPLVLVLNTTWYYGARPN